MDFLLHNHNYIWLILAVVSGFFVFRHSFGGSPDDLSPQQAVLLINRQDAVVVDVREDAEFSTGHLIDARHIPLKDLAEKTGELKKFSKRPIIVVCQTGHRAAQGLDTLKKAGFEQVFKLAGGVAAWQAAGQAIKKG